MQAGGRTPANADANFAPRAQHPLPQLADQRELHATGKSDEMMKEWAGLALVSLSTRVVRQRRLTEMTGTRACLTMLSTNFGTARC